VPQAGAWTHGDTSSGSPSIRLSRTARGDREPAAYPRRTTGGRKRRSAARRRYDHKLPVLAPWDNSNPVEGSSTTKITRHEAEALPVTGRSATSFHAADLNSDPNHDADIRIGSEAPKQRCPFLTNVEEKPSTSSYADISGSYFQA
jgi:hypothetical protein